MLPFLIRPENMARPQLSHCPPRLNLLLTLEMMASGNPNMSFNAEVEKGEAAYR